jgi:hypothetical protein
VGSNAVLETAFFFGFLGIHSPVKFYKIRLHPFKMGVLLGVSR